MATKQDVDKQRRAIINRANEQLREIEILFNTAAHWNDSVRKPHEKPIDADPDGQMARIRDNLAEGLCRETKHKIPREKWVEEIKRVAKETYHFTDEGVAKTDWYEYAHQYYLDSTPAEALKEDFSNQ